METYARELASALRGLADDPTTITDWEPADRLTNHVRHFKPLAATARYIDRYLAYQCQIYGRDADVNHIVDHGYGHLAFSLNCRRTVVTFHDAMLLKLDAGELHQGAAPKGTIVGHRLSLRAIRRVARVITVSHRSRQDFLRFVDYDPDRVSVIYNGVSEMFQPRHDVAGDDADASSKRAAHILHVGHCGFYKNIDLILRSIPAISKEIDRPVVFVKVGGPFTKSQMELIARLGLEGRVKHLGFVPRAELPDTYAQADLLLMPSLYEGFGLPALEAMACGTPVVASNCGALPEVVAEAALLIDPWDPDSVVNTVARVLTDPRLRSDLRRRGLEQARNFSWRRTADQTMSVYQAVHDENR
jgi:glycosyltransferase involved in cell wall biosynthesis